MLNKCPYCGGELKAVHKKVGIDMPNPGQILVDGKFHECQNCHEGFFDEKESKDFSQEICKAVKKAKNSKPKKLPSGSFII